VNASFGHALTLSDPMGLPSIEVTIEEFIEFHFEMTQELTRLNLLAEENHRAPESELNTRDASPRRRRSQSDSFG
jgi:hypothetical protein